MHRSRQLPFFLAAIAGLTAFAIALGLGATLAVPLGADIFFTVYIAATLTRLERLHKDALRTNPGQDDVPPIIIFIVTLVTVAAAAASLFELINADAKPTSLHLVLSLAALPLGWFTIHLMAAIHYAHLFWEPGPGEDKPRLGLEFPGTDDPDIWDFIYFAFVIGMTAQTSDVQISGRHIRRFNLKHSIVTFFFNTVLVAAAVNLAVSLGS